MITASTISGLFSSGMVMLVAMGVVQIDTSQQAAILGFVAVAVPVAISFWPRSQVTSVKEPQALNVDGTMVQLVPVDGSELPGHK